MSSDGCEVKRCDRTAYITYLGRGVCEKHWGKHCDSGHKLLKDAKMFMPQKR